MVITITILEIILSFNTKEQNMLNDANNIYQINFVIIQKINF